jgi:transposase
MKRDGTESCPPLTITSVINTGAPPMTTTIDTGDICCVALELSKASWLCAFAVPGDSQVTVHKIKASDVDRLMGILNSSKAKAEQQLGRPLQIVLCYEVGYDGFWLARLLTDRPRAS